MAEGSLVVNLQTLQTALAGVATLLGESGTAGTPGTGLAGGAALAATSPTARVTAFQDVFQGQVAGLLAFDAAAGVTPITTFFTTLQATVQQPPTAALTTFQQQLTGAGAAFDGNFVQGLQTALTAIQTITQHAPANPTGVVNTLLDQILAVLGSLEGPEAENIRTWLQSLQDLESVLVPLIAQAQHSPDPAVMLVQVIERALQATLEVFGFSEIQSLLTFFDSFAGRLLPPALLTTIDGNLTSVATTYAQPTTLVAADFPIFRDAVVSASEAMQDLKFDVQPLLQALHRLVNAKILQPHALATYLRSRMDAALGTPVRELQEINSPYSALLDRMDAAIAGIDLDFVRTDVLGFFDRVRTAITAANLGNLDATLQAQLAPVTQALQQVEQAVSTLLTQLRTFFANLVAQARTLASNVGQFRPDGTFEYAIAGTLRQLLAHAQTAIGGDPNHPGAPSVAGAINEFHGVIDQFIGQLQGLLTPVQSALTGVVTTAVDGVNTFADFMAGLNLADLVGQLRQQVTVMLDQLGTVDFDLVVDPVVQAIEGNNQKLRDIDPATLNDLLRAALQVALDVIINIDFTVTIGKPLKDGFAELKKLPAAALAELQKRYEQALAFLHALSPTQLLQALFAAFDVIHQAAGALNISSLLQPLDELHARFLQQPLAQLKPSTVLQPVHAAFQSFMSTFQAVDGAALLAPLTTQLDALKATIANFNITGWIDDLLAAIEQAKTALRGLRPSQLLQPLVADFARLESELDRLKPSVVFAPVAALATPLLQFLETIQQETVTALFNLFQMPVQVLERLEPQRLEQQVVAQIDAVLTRLRGLNLPGRYNQLKAHYFDLTVAVGAQSDQRRVEVALLIDPDLQMGDLLADYMALLTGLEALKGNVQISGELTAVYAELRTRLLGLLPAYARTLLDPETFKRLLRLADPTRFLAELDQRFTAIKNKLIVIRPEELTGELDSSYEAVLALLDNLDISASLNTVKQQVEQLKGLIQPLRVDFVAADITKAVNDLRALLNGLDPTTLLVDLDALHQQVEQVVQQTQPSVMLADLQALAGELQTLVAAVDPRTTLGAPLQAAWDSVESVLDDLDFTVVLAPLVAKLDELEAAFMVALQRTETAFDAMLTNARTAVGGGTAVSVGGSI